MSIRKAVNEKCKDCIYDPLAGGTWLVQVGNCIDTPCPLHPYRPLPASMKSKGDSLVKRAIPAGLKAWQESRKSET